MYRSVDDFRAHFQEEVEDTLKVLRAVPDSAAAQAVTPAHRDLRRMAWHLVESLVSLPCQIGLTVDGPAVDDTLTCLEPVPGTMGEIIARYDRAAASLRTALAPWVDADLLREETLYGHLRWTRGYALQALELHQAHHRGQMTVLLRQAGLPVPAFYGPVLEDWAGLGAPVPAV